MIKTTAMILEELSDYKSPQDKLARLVKSGKYIPIKRGLYETDKKVASYLLAGSIYGPSYISFEFALSFYGLIPEKVVAVTSASFEKKKKKFYQTKFGNFSYKDVPSIIFPLGINILKEGNYYFRMASPEKALCDKLYDTSVVVNQKELLQLLEEDLRIYIDDLRDLDYNFIKQIAEIYPSSNVKKFALLLRRLRR